MKLLRSRHGENARSRALGGDVICRLDASAREHPSILALIAAGEIAGPHSLRCWVDHPATDRLSLDRGTLQPVDFRATGTPESIASDASRPCS